MSVFIGQPVCSHPMSVFPFDGYIGIDASEVCWGDHFFWLYLLA
jgi:hypothetical protein